VENCQRLAYVFVSKRRQPARFSGVHVFIQVGAHRLHEEDIAESCDYGSGPGACGLQFLDDMVYRQPQPRGSSLLAAPYVDHGRQHRYQRFGGAVLKLHPSANKFRNRAASSSAKRAMGIRLVLLNHFEEIDRLTSRRIPQSVLVASRYQYEVAGR
jgi:hypothetical protein